LPQFGFKYEENAPLTNEQVKRSPCFVDEAASPYVLIAPRGRGKSTLLGDSLAKMLCKANKKVALTGPISREFQTLKLDSSTC